MQAAPIVRNKRVEMFFEDGESGVRYAVMDCGCEKVRKISIA